METTRIQLRKVSKKHSTIYLMFTILMLVIGIVGVILTLVFDNDKFYGKTETYAFFVIYGGGLIFIAKKYYKAVDYFVSWDDNDISYQLPNTKTLVTIKIEEIKSVEKSPREIQITLNNNEIKHFKFTYFFLPKRTSVLDYFESLKTQIKQRM